MSDGSMPDTIVKMIDQAFSPFPDVMMIDKSIDDSVAVLVKVANHPDPDCDFVAKLQFSWDIPGQLCCMASIGVWNPPAPMDGYITSSLIDLSEGDQKAMHAILLRAVAVPERTARKGHDMVRLMIESVLTELRKANTPFSDRHFDDPDNPEELLARSFHGLVKTEQGNLIQWSDLVDWVRD